MCVSAGHTSVFSYIGVISDRRVLSDLFGVPSGTFFSLMCSLMDLDDRGREPIAFQHATRSHKASTASPPTDGFEGTTGGRGAFRKHG